VAKNDSTAALSKQSPVEPKDWSASSSTTRWEKVRDV
jgi:hypothetical protein